MLIFYKDFENNFVFWDTKKFYHDLKFVEKHKKDIFVSFGSQPARKLKKHYNVNCYDVSERTDHSLEWSMLSRGKALSDKPEDVIDEIATLFVERQEDFNSKIEILKMFNLPMKYISYSYAQLAAVILKAKPVRRHDEFDIDVPDNVEISKYKNIVEKLRCRNNYSDVFVEKIGDIEYTFGFGGLHGAKPKYNETGLFLEMDVVSMYPSIMVNNNLNSRNCDSENYKNLYNMKIIKTSKIARTSLKKILNTTYGCLKDRRNKLYDPRQANRVINHGQVYMLDLIEHLEDWCEIVQLNTDGILVKMPDSWNRQDDGCEMFRLAMNEITKQWQIRTGLILSFKWYNNVHQKDVNNYVIAGEDVKCKGAYVCDLTLDNYQMAIVNAAVRNYFVDNIKPEITINSCNDASKFQILCEAGKKYDGLRCGGRTARVFATKNGIKINKYKNNRVEKIAGTPEKCFVNNNKIEDVPVENIDKNWYVEETYKRIKDYGAV